MNLLTRTLALAALVFILFPVTTRAAAFSPYFGPLLSCTGNYTQDIQNASGSVKKCSSVCDLLETGNNISKWIMTMALYVVAPIVFTIGAAMIMLGGASAKLVSQGRQMMWGTAIAIAMVLGSYVIVSTIFFLIPTKNPVQWGNFSCNPATVPGGELDVEHFTVCSQCGNDQICSRKANGGWECTTPASSSPP